MPTVEDLTGAEIFLMRFIISSLRGFDGVGQLFTGLPSLVWSRFSGMLALARDSLEPLPNELPELFKIPGLCRGERGEYEGEEVALGESTKLPV